MPISLVDSEPTQILQTTFVSGGCQRLTAVVTIGKVLRLVTISSPSGHETKECGKRACARESEYAFGTEPCEAIL
jgi:hypothetical protein